VNFSAHSPESRLRTGRDRLELDKGLEMQATGLRCINFAIVEVKAIRARRWRNGGRVTSPAVVEIECLHLR
jgi:hypothetical protein